MGFKVDETHGNVLAIRRRDAASIYYLAHGRKNPAASLECARPNSELALNLVGRPTRLNSLINRQQEVHERVVASMILAQLDRQFDRLQILESRIWRKDTNANILM